MKTITMLYILNATLLLLHEIESAYEKEWEILKLPGKITGFLLLHIPIIILIFYGLIEIDKNSTIGALFGIVAGIGGVILTQIWAKKTVFVQTLNSSLVANG